ncbi:class I SAM-dependent methyltransferase [Siminovitchia sediminis]|uniref:Class I SAM-dependent methyltransferase n=1 Tax=Siminovitchia sediminis TaxID=1274353 RepID=A0ABW4KAG7_9BACI
MRNQWHERFSAEEYIYGEEPNAFIKSKAHLLKDQSKIVCFAEGEGRNAVFLAKEGHEVTALDYAESGLLKTQRLADKNDVKVKTCKADLLEYEVKASRYDAAVMVFGHFHGQDQKTVFDKMLKAVKPGGMIMMEVYSKEQISYGTGGPRDTDMLYDPADLLDWSRGHKVRHFFYGEQFREEGKLHTGKAHVNQLILVKKG